MMEENAYVLLHKIDEGAFGEIFCVRGRKDKQLLAMKQILYRGDISSDPYIMHELRNLSNLKHKNIIMLMDVIITDKSVNLVMELAENGNLEEAVQGNKVASDQFSHIFHQILSAVHFCHLNKVAHRDLTPCNILLTSQTSVRLADFGLSVPCRDSEGKVILCDDYLGHLHYSAPEVLKKTPYDPLLSDMWSLGVVLYFMIHSSVPFVGEEEDIISQQTDIKMVTDKINRKKESKDTYFGMLQVVMKNVLRVAPAKRRVTGDLLQLMNNET
ncbi:testis-specific serine/threonine-protein kinase 1-like [Ostrea edulis]|uniref:testis-specific serine/threonine-protein kinase 1-like n=1 Tax=Ostrea edulis TaxID=37623 RepID=UPI0024AED968|nr:testis-specific serine/threonine-protein kinase 1-like [Ostrea edulis]XP_056019722.1 testis-specific serine/threonine-protein kinase 1-like [Ostrea edulis]